MIRRLMDESRREDQPGQPSDFESVRSILPRVIDPLFDAWNVARDQRTSLEPAADTPFDSTRSLSLDRVIIEEERLTDRIVKHHEAGEDL